MGTLQYMAPEQLQGQEADGRSDLFAFGCVLYELVAGKRAFDGASAASVIAAIMEREPAPLRITAPLERVVRKCLAKDPEERFQTARDLKTSLLWAMEQQPAKPHSVLPASKLPWVIAAAVAILTAFGGWAAGRRALPTAPAEAHVLRYTIPAPENVTYRAGKISPDGRSIALLAIESSGRRQLMVRRLDSLAAQALAPAAEGDPFWSPDSRFIAFQYAGKLMKIDASGGAPQTICSADLVIGGSWNRDGDIIFGTGEWIAQVSANGGEPKFLTGQDASRAETTHMFPAFLPDGRHFLYTIHSSRRENGGIYLGSLDSPKARIQLLKDVSNARYAAASPADPGAGYVLFVRGDVLMAQRFDAGRLQLKGEALAVVDKVARSASNLAASFSVSDDGVLFLSTPIFSGDRLMWFDRSGKRIGAVGEAGLHFQPRLSPDEITMAIEQIDAEAFVGDIWLLPTAGGAPSRFTFTNAGRPLWTPDGRRIAFISPSTYDIFVKTVAGTAKEERLLDGGGVQDRILCDWSSDGRFLLYSDKSSSGKYELRLLPMAGGKPISYLQNEANNRCGVFSPDGKWMAYFSDASGRSEVYVQTFSPQDAGSGRIWQVSYNGATWPIWRRDGKELYYLSSDRNLVAVEVKTGASFEAGVPRPLFFTGIYTPDARFEATGDGKRFLVPTAILDENAVTSTVIVNWSHLLARAGP